MLLGLLWDITANDVDKFCGAKRVKNKTNNVTMDLELTGRYLLQVWASNTKRSMICTSRIHFKQVPRYSTQLEDETTNIRFQIKRATSLNIREEKYRRDRRSSRCGLSPRNKYETRSPILKKTRLCRTEQHSTCMRALIFSLPHRSLQFYIVSPRTTFAELLISSTHSSFGQLRRSARGAVARHVAIRPALTSN